MTRLESIFLGFALAALGWVAWMPTFTVHHVPKQQEPMQARILEWARSVAPEADHILLVGPGSCACSSRSIQQRMDVRWAEELYIVSSQSARLFVPDNRIRIRTVPDAAFPPWPGRGVDLLITDLMSDKPVLLFSLSGDRFEHRLSELLGRSAEPKGSSR